VRYENDPGLYAAWKSASHIERPQPKPKDPAAPVESNQLSVESPVTAGVNSTALTAALKPNGAFGESALPETNGSSRMGGLPA